MHKMQDFARQIFNFFPGVMPEPPRHAGGATPLAPSITTKGRAGVRKALHGPAVQKLATSPNVHNRLTLGLNTDFIITEKNN